MPHTAKPVRAMPAAIRSLTASVFLVLPASLAAQAPAPASPALPMVVPFSGSASGATSGLVREPWRVETLSKMPRHTRFELEPLEGRLALKVTAEGSYANLVHPLKADGALLRWRWRVDAMSEATDLTRREGDDVPARLCVLYDVPLERLGTGVRWKLRLARMLYDARLPAAAICYVWDAKLPAGTWLPNAHTDRVQLLVLRSAASGHRRGAWFEEARDVRADFARAFPDEAREGPVPVSGVAISADGDNTGAASVAWFGDIVLEPSLP